MPSTAIIIGRDGENPDGVTRRRLPSVAGNDGDPPRVPRSAPWSDSVRVVIRAYLSPAEITAIP
jgi:hypothetical protein